MNYRIHVKNDTGDWWEDMEHEEVVDLASAEKMGKAIIKRYNETLYKGDKPRTFIEADLGGEAKKEHKLHKLNLYTLHDSSGFYDKLECEVCGFQVLRYGFEGYVRRGKFKAKKWR